MIKNLVMVKWNGQVEVIIRVTFKMMLDKDMDKCFGMMEHHIKVNGIIIVNMDMVEFIMVD